jgi:hypothetical protein
MFMRNFSLVSLVVPGNITNVTTNTKMMAVKNDHVCMKLFLSMTMNTWKGVSTGAFSMWGEGEGTRSCEVLVLFKSVSKRRD